MKVVMLTRESLPFHSYGGMQRYVWCLSWHLANIGIEVEMVLPYPENRQKLEPINNLKFTFIGPAVRKPFFWFRYLLFSFRAASYLSKAEFDILHGFEINPFFYLRKKNRKPTVVQTFGNEPLKTEGIKRMLHRIRWAPFLKSVVRRADFVASEGKIQTDELQHMFGISQEKIFYLPDGIDLERITKLLANLNKRRQDFGFDDNDLLIICVSRLAVNKGVRYLIEAMDTLKRRHANIKLILVGSGPEEKEITGLIRKLGLSRIIRHFKNIDDQELFQYYALSDIFVLPTLYEGLPLVLLEAEACGLPIITTQTGENEQVVKDGLNGFLVPPKDPIAIAEAVEKFYARKLMNKMAEASKELAKDYDWPNIAQMASSEYEKILRGR